MHRRWKGNWLAAFGLGTAISATMCVAAVTAQEVLVLTDDEWSVFAGPYLSVLKDEHGTWTIEDVTAGDLAQSFEQSSTLIPILGYSRMAYWIRLKLVRETESDEDWYLSLDNKSLDHIELYLPDDRGGLRRHVTGDAHPFDTREIAERHFVFPLSIPDTVITLHLRIASNGPIHLPIRLLSAEALLDDTRRAYLRIGGLFGVLVVMALFHLVFYLAVKDFTYLIYVGFLGSLILYNLSVERFAFQFLWPDNMWLADRSNSMLGLLCAVMAIEFTRAFLDTKELTPRWDRWLRGAQGGCAVLFVMFLTGLSLSLGVVTSAFFGVMVFLVIGVSVAGIRRRKPASKIFLTAWSFLLLGTLVSVMGNLGLLPPQHFAGARGVQAGSVLTLILFALALGERLNQMIRSREELRIRIANDLHDDIGAGLTEIVLGSYLLRKKTASTEDQHLALEIESRARALTASMRDVVWTVSPTKESWKDVEDRMHDVAAGLLGPAGIVADLQGEGGAETRLLPLGVRHDVLHTFKESVHNAVKHAKCTRFEARWKVDSERVWMRMKDDGVGFAPNEVTYGHGIESLRKRIHEARGSFSITSRPGEGTTIELEVPLS